MENSTYETILAAYPLYMTKEQMYQICHISKRTCLFLLESGLVPCQDSGKKTRRFRIYTEDVIRYLEDREVHPELYKPPVGFYNQKFKNTNAPTSLTQDDIQFMRKFYEAKLGKYPDVLSSKQVSSFTGYDTTSVNNWCEKNKLKHFCIKRKNLVPKVYLIDFLVSWDYIGIGVKSKRHKNMNKKLWKELQSQR